MVDAEQLVDKAEEALAAITAEYRSQLEDRHKLLSSEINAIHERVSGFYDALERTEVTSERRKEFSDKLSEMLQLRVEKHRLLRRIEAILRTLGSSLCR